MGKAFVREVQVVRSDRKGEQMKDIELNVMTEGRKAYYSSARRRIRRYLTAPKQDALNDKHARIYIGRLINMNFGKGDYCSHLTYSQKFLPATLEDGKRDLDRFIGKVKKLYAERGLKLRYICIPSYRSGKGGELTRLHFHIVMAGGVDRTEIELLWRAPDKAGRCKKGDEHKRFGESLGTANCDRLQVGDGLGGLSNYLARQPREGFSRRWYASVGLRKPYTYAPNDDKYDIPELKRIAERNADAVDVSFWERKYPGWTVCEPREYAYSCVMSDISGVSILCKLRRLTEEELRERNKQKRQKMHVSGAGRRLDVRKKERRV